jgi:Cysteine rich repeat
MCNWSVQFCADVPPGHMRAIDCLEMNRYESDFSPGCRDTLEASISERAADFRLDASLRAACSKDIERRYRFCISGAMPAGFTRGPAYRLRLGS